MNEEKYFELIKNFYQNSYEHKKKETTYTLRKIINKFLDKNALKEELIPFLLLTSYIDPELIQDYVCILSDFIKNNKNSKNIKILYNCIKAITESTKSNSVENITLYNSLSYDLTDLIYSASKEIVGASIEALSFIITRHNIKESHLVKIINNSYNQIKTKIGKVLDNVGSINRSLYIVGQFFYYYNFNKLIEYQLENKNESIGNTVYNLCKELYEESGENIEIKCSVLETLSCLWFNFPMLTYNSSPLLDDCFLNMKNGLDIERILEIFLDFLTKPLPPCTDKTQGMNY